MPEEVWNTNIVGSFCNMPIMSNSEQYNKYKVSNFE